MSLLHQPIDARALGPDWGDEFVEGNLVISHRALQFESVHGKTEIPLERLGAEVRVGDEERIAFTDSAAPGLVVFAANLELLDCPIQPLQQARAALVERLSRREMRRRLRMLAWCAVVIVVATILGSLATSYMVRAIAARVSVERDAEFGASELAKLRAEWSFLEDSNAVAQVAAMTDPLVHTLPVSTGTNGYQFHIIRHQDPNAFALPGGHVIVTTAMLELADAEELLGVIAHEIAHVNQRHIYRQAIGSVGPLTLCSVFMGRSQLGRIMGGGAALLIGAGFSQEYETEADEVGWDYLIKANVDPRGMIRLFSKLEGIEAREGFNPTPQAFRSHPATTKRIRLLEARWSSLRRQSGFLELPARSRCPVVHLWRLVLRPAQPRKSTKRRALGWR